MGPHFKQLSDATVQIYCGIVSQDDGSGSGFHLGSPQRVVTNAHVVQSAFNTSSPILAVTESGEVTELEVLEYSPPVDRGGDDFAVCKVQDEFSEERVALEPRSEDVKRGEEVLFSGFPHGISDLLVHSARVSGFDEENFYLDGSVNGGNSGGPIIDTDGQVIGIVTYSRFISKEMLEEARQKLDEAENKAENAQFVKASGQPITASSEKLSEVIELLGQMLRINANTGIGLGRPIQPCIETLQ